jgi:mutator protein MutT
VAQAKGGAMSLAKPVMVVAAVIERQGKILICQRKRGSKHAYKWEFAGGKVETGETPAEALKRELREELSIDAVIGEEIERYEFRYPGRLPIQLIFFRVREFEGEPENLVFEAIEWTRPEQMPSYDFLDGDIEFVKRLVERKKR